MIYIYYAILALLFYLFLTPNQYTYVGLDFSWAQALAIAIDNKETFGTNFIFNYGPLGYLNTYLLPNSVSVWVMVVYHLFLFCNYSLGLHSLFEKYSNKKLTIFILFLIAFLPHFSIGDASFNLLFLLAFWILENERKAQNWHWILIIILANLLFFIKLNLYLLGHFFVFLFVIHQFIHAKISLSKGLLLLLLNVMVCLFFSKILNVNIVEYIISGIKIIGPYQDGMSVNYLTPEEEKYLYFTNLIVFCILLYFWYLSKLNLIYTWCITLLIGLYFLVLFKQTHTVMVHGNFQTFTYGFLSLCLLLGIFLLQKNNQKKFISIVFIYFGVFSCINLWVQNYPHNLKEIIFHKMKLNRLNQYASHLKNYNFQNNYLPNLVDSVRLEPQILQKIGNNTIDILPTQIDHIFFNKLNYCHRPIIQSYQANSDWLQAKNGAFYSDLHSAPNFVLANIQGFRDQNGMWMDKSSYQQILINYKPIDTNINKAKDTLILFQKNSNYKKIIEEKIIESESNLKNWIIVPKDTTLIYLKANIKYSPIGKLKRFVYQPPFLMCEIIYENGESKTFRVPPPILESGILINYKITTTAELSRLAQKQTNLLLKVSKIKFHGTNFDQGFKAEFYRLNAK